MISGSGRSTTLDYSSRGGGAVGVVMLDVLGEYGFEMAATEDEHPVEALAPQGACHALTDGVRSGCPDRALDDPGALCGGMTASKEAVYLVSRSRMRNLTVFAWSARSIERLRACWVTQSVTGLAVPPAIRTRRVSWWMNTRT